MIESKSAFWLAYVARLLIPFACLAKKKPKIIVVSHGQASDPFWLMVRNGVETAARETDSEVEYHAPEKFDLVAMSKLIDGAVSSKPDGLIVSIPDAAAMANRFRLRWPRR